MYYNQYNINILQVFRFQCILGNHFHYIHQYTWRQSLNHFRYRYLINDHIAYCQVNIQSSGKHIRFPELIYITAVRNHTNKRARMELDSKRFQGHNYVMIRLVRKGK